MMPNRRYTESVGAGAKLEGVPADSAPVCIAVAAARALFQQPTPQA
jgi:hypothetical protein